MRLTYIVDHDNHTSGLRKYFHLSLASSSFVNPTHNAGTTQQRSQYTVNDTMVTLVIEATF